MSYGSWFLDETPLPKLGFLGQGNNGYVTLVRNNDGLLMAKKTSFLKYSEDLEKEVRIMDRFFSINFNTVRATSPAVSYETMPFNVKVCSIHMEVAPHATEGSLEELIMQSPSTSHLEIELLQCSSLVFALHLEKCSEDLLQNTSRTLLLLESEPAKGKGSEKNAQPTWVHRCLRASDAADVLLCGGCCAGVQRRLY
ncbi:hypothetical protein F2Q69_00015013 [Brassica cretica]|uniref:Protein kinase domain-containing protein n=1 Tax=Brassica cretica TaxID=69181 RepID=A0A8S9R736_BRACR|nr:hypothetical protein F2Q69_00015013 [Brassica cretica]